MHFCVIRVVWFTDRVHAFWSICIQSCPKTCCSVKLSVVILNPLKKNPDIALGLK
jgi:hypothetical protein